MDDDDNNRTASMVMNEVAKGMLDHLAKRGPLPCGVVVVCFAHNQGELAVGAAGNVPQEVVRRVFSHIVTSGN